MKKWLFSIIALFCLAPHISQAQAFDKSNMLLSLGLGGVDEVTIHNAPHPLSPVGHYTFTPFRPQFHFKAEFGVHRYWSVGLISSVDGRRNMPYPYDVAPSRYSQLDVQLGLLVNFHFYQLIADKTGMQRIMHADKLDIYTGFMAGANYINTWQYGASNHYFSPIAGVHLGARYYVTPSISVFGEIGLGQSNFNVGITIKLFKPKKVKQPKDF
jgi:hypothetical protein